MKISYLLSGWGHTGGFMVLYNFMDKLCDRGYTVHAVTPHETVRWRPLYSRELLARFRAGGRTRRIKAVIKRFVPVQRIRQLGATREGLSLQRNTQALVANWVPADVTIATAWQTAFAGYALADKTIAMYHMQHWEELFFQDEFHRKLARMTYYLPLRPIANSSWLREEVRSRLQRDAFLLLPGTDTATFYPRQPIAAKYAVTGKTRIVCYYSPQAFKGWPDAVEAMKLVFAQLGPDAVEWIVYGGRPAVLPEIPATFVGAVFGNQLAELYSSAHIVFMPSWYESFPLPPIEAMASGTAAVVTGTGTEDYAFNGVNALVRPARQPQALAAAIVELALDRQRACQLAEEGFATASRMHWDWAMDNLETVLKRATADATRDADNNAAVGSVKDGLHREADSHPKPAPHRPLPLSTSVAGLQSADSK